MNVPIGVLVLSMFVLGTAHAAPMFKTKNDDGSPIVFRLLSEPCNPKVAEHLNRQAPPDIAAKFKASTLEWKGKVYHSCYLVQGGYVFSIDEAGDILQPIPYQFFREDTI